MPRYQQKRTFQLGDYWLSKQARSEAWCRTWFDPKTGQTKRASLRTTDFERAKQVLTDWFISQQTLGADKTEDVTLAEIFARFYEQHGSTLKSATEVQRLLRYWLEFHGEATVDEAARQDRQAAFRAWLQTEKGLGLATVRYALTVGK